MKIFPVDPKTKAPLVAGGLYAAKQWDEWNGTESTAWGTPTGDGYFVLDVDVKATDGRVSLERFDKLPTTYTVQTQSGGLHYYFRTQNTVRNKVGLLPGVDVRGVGGYVVVPPSPGYVVIEEAPMAEPPPWLTSLLAPAPKVQKESAAQAEVMEGGRNHYLTQVAGRMQRSNLLTLEALEAINERDCTPPLDDQEVLMIYNSVLRYAPSNPIEVQSSPIVWAGSMAGDMLAYLSDKEKVKGEPTLLDSLDALLGGGKRLGEVTVTLAEAKTGKNTLWHKLMFHWLEKGIAIGYASRELSPAEEVLPNLFSLKLQENYWLKEDYDHTLAQDILSKWKLAFPPGYGSIPNEELFSWMDACRDAGIQYIWIDHLHYCLDDPEDFKAISKLIRAIKSYAKEHAVHVDLIVQPKLQEQGMRLSLNSLRGGAAIGQALDNLITMTRVRDEGGQLTNVVKVQLEVARSKLARLGHLFLRYNRDTTDFEEVVPDTAPASPEEREEEAKSVDGIRAAGEAIVKRLREKNL